ncbi:hypothetical protein AAUPMB_04872, partial [Pasteurella multocida subsp. multocida str. Anand1_buffalo]
MIGGGMPVGAFGG